MKYLSVCSGIEAATVAWHGLGWEPVAFAEIEPFPAAVLAHHYPSVPNLGDLTKYREWPEERLAEVDLLVGGTPCQAFSVAGQRRSLDDERGNLSLIYVNLYHHINEVRKRHGRQPAIALWENVPGVLSTKDNAFGCFIGGLLGCDEAPATESGKWDKAGFLSSETVRVGYRVLDAQYFGVAQRRRRVFLVAVPCELVERLGERACPSEILSLRESVLGNPPSRGKAWEGVARATAAGLASSGRGVERCGESQGQDDVVIWSASDQANAERLVDQAGTLNCNLGQRGGWIAGCQDPVAFGGNRSSGPIDVATSVLAHSGPHGRQDFASETFVFTGDGVIADPIGASEAKTYTHEGTTFRLHNCVGVCATGEKTHALTTRRACEEDGTGRGTPIVPAVAFSAKDSGGDAANEVSPTMRAMHHIDGNANAGGQLAVAFKPGQSEAAGGTSVTEEFAPTVQAQNNGSTAAPAVAFTKAKPNEAVAFKPSHYTRGKDGQPSEVTPPLSADADKGDQDTIIAFDTTQITSKSNYSRPKAGDPCHPLASGAHPPAVAFSDSAAAHSYGVAQTVEHTPPLRGGQEGNVIPAVVSFAQNQLGEVRVNADVMGTVNQNQNASGRNTPMVFSNRTRDGIKVPEVMKDGVVPALTNPGNGGRADAVNVASSMQVRRLCPSECEALQGFPIGYTDVQYRKKPAADGPRYRALGNSMAVPCMWWLGYRIQNATQTDNA